ncbi:MAG: AMP-binding protein [Eubacteriales bacterium]|nr:AMP-binding protein [Eubacteriales bacterium]
MNSKKYKDQRYQTRIVKDIRELLQSSVALYPERNAFLIKEAGNDNYVPVTFQKLKEDMDALGTALLDLGLLGKKIVVIGENRYEWALSYFAVTCGVGVIVPMERELQYKEIKHLCEWVGVSAIIYTEKVEKVVVQAAQGQPKLEYLIGIDTESQAAEVAEQPLSFWQLIERGKDLIKNGNRDYIDAKIDDEAMSMLLFTSGTTGVAKGVMLSHKNIISNVLNMSQYVNVQNWVGLSVLPMHHTYEMTCHVLTALYQGCTIAICEGLKHIQKNMQEAQVRVMLGVPLLFEMMHKKIWKEAEKTGKAKKLRLAITLSQKLHLYNTGIAKKLFREIHEKFGGQLSLLIAGAAGIDPTVTEDFTAMGIPMIQGYGMTENSPIIAVNLDRYSKAAAVGLPMPNTLIDIIDADENGIGEIICKSDSIMLGYYENPEETARVVIDGWLHTGDYGYFDEDGFLYLTGRKKNVIVTKNGKNIFPEEVELYLLRNDWIKECVVFGMSEDDDDLLVCAEIFPDYDAIMEATGIIGADRIREMIKKAVDEANANMPGYKRVRRFTIRETEFDKTASRKIKRYSIGNKESETL